MDNEVIIKVQDLRKTFRIGTGEVEVLKGINADIHKGDFVIIFGPSGCGKSTFLHTMLGLEAPTSGTIHVEGKDFYEGGEDDRARYRRHKVGMIYQQALWIGSMSVIENVMFPLRILNVEEDVAYKKAIDALTVVGMQDWADYMPTELSSGQQQKISLARALSKDPLIIVADEPTGNLDTVSGKELLETFLMLVDRGVTIFMVTHDLEYLQFATRIFHMLDGEVVEEYTPKKGNKNLKTVGGKKEISGSFMTSNIRDPEFLKKLKI